jgi:hypothetical protein
MNRAFIVLGVLLLIAVLCGIFAPAPAELGRVKKEMCINADVMDDENFGKQVPCDD